MTDRIRSTSIERPGGCGKRRGTVVTAALVWLCISNTTYGATTAIERLAGRYVGVNVGEATTSVTPAPSDIHLDMQPSGQRFVLRWQSLSVLATGTRHHYEVVFKKTPRSGIYLAEMGCDLFGNARPLDPGRGEPYMWAYIGDAELTLYAMYIANDGSHDLSRYLYRWAGDSVTLKYERVRNEQPIERLQAVLRRATASEIPLDLVTKVPDERHAAVNCG